MLDARSVDPAEQLFSYGMVTRDGGVKYNSSVAHCSKHRWVYFPRQTADEVPSASLTPTLAHPHPRLFTLKARSCTHASRPRRFFG